VFNVDRSGWLSDFQGLVDQLIKKGQLISGNE